MDKLKQWIALAVLASVAIVAGGWMTLISPKRQEAVDLEAAAVAQQQANAVLETQLRVLKGQAKDLPKEQAKLALVATKLPPSRALPQLIRALTKASDSTGVALVTITPGQPVLATASAPTQAAAGAPAAAAAPSVGSLARVPISLRAYGSYFELERFAAALEELPRALRVTGLTLAPGSSPLSASPSAAPAQAAVTDAKRTLAASITAEVYMIVNQPAAAPAVPAAPAAPAAS